jgi:hypothetical protein
MRINIVIHLFLTPRSFLYPWTLYEAPLFNYALAQVLAGSLIVLYT